MPENERPFDPEAPQRVAAFLRARDVWREEQGGCLRDHVGAFPNPDKPESDEVCELTAPDLKQLVDRLDFRDQEAEQLAEACGRYRSERNEARAMVRSLVDFMRLAGIQNDEIAAIIPISNELTPWLTGKHPAAVQSDAEMKPFGIGDQYEGEG